MGREYSKKWKNIYRFWSFPFGAVNIFNPEDIEVSRYITVCHDIRIIHIIDITEPKAQKKKRYVCFLFDV